MLTKKQEEVIRLCHQDFGGLTEAEAAERLGIDQSSVSRRLARAEANAPQLFPIITKLQAQCHHYLMCDGWSPKEIAEYIGKPINSVYKALQACGKKGLPLSTSHGDVMRYDPGMDAEVVKKF